MGDTTFCVLITKPELTEQHKNAFKAVWSSFDYCFDNNGKTTLGYDGVNYGELPGELATLLRDNGYKWLWDAGAGDGYGPSFTCYDPDKGDAQEWDQAHNSHDIVLRVREIDAQTLAEARQWQTWIDDMVGVD